MEDKVTYIYGLTENDKIRYIGKSNNPKKRLSEHIREAKRIQKTHKQQWLYSLILENKPIGIRILEITNDDEWGEREKYWINHYGLNNLTNYELGGRGGKPKKDWLPFNDARELVMSLSLENVNQWKLHCKSKDRNEFIPCYPNSVYKNDGWVSWSDWLGTDFIATQNRTYLSFSESKKIIHKLNLSSQSKWFDYIRKNTIEGIPNQPNRVYRSEWVSWGDWLGTDFIATQNRTYLSFSDAKKFIHKLNIKTHKYWREYCKKDKPEYIPSNPNVVYKDEWINWNDWFGINILPFQQSRKIIHKLKIKSNKEWRECVKQNKIPDNIPTSPKTYYKNEWVSWYDWLGK